MILKYESNKNMFIKTILCFFWQGFKVAYIIFKKAAALNKVKSHPYDKVLSLSSDEAPILTGIKSKKTRLHHHRALRIPS